MSHDNDNCVERAENVIIGYGGKFPSGEPACSKEEDLIDLLTDVMHWCKKNGFDFSDRLRVATDHFNCEAEEGEAHATE